MSAEKLTERLKSLSNSEQAAKNERYFKGEDGETEILGTPFGKIFKTAKEFEYLPLDEVKKLLYTTYYEARMAAVSVMDFKARKKSLPDQDRRDLFELYIQNHHRINNWDLVDRGAWRVVGNYLLNKDRSILYKLAREGSNWEKRTSIVSTYAFIRNGEVDDTLNIAEILLNDNFELTNRAVGTWVREVGKKSPEKLIEFLEKNAATMPRISLRYAVEKLNKGMKNKFLNMKKKQ